MVKGFFSDDVKGEKIITGYYPGGSQNFSSTISLSGSSTPPKGVVIKVVNSSDVIGVSVKGNAAQ